ncbi:homocysteine S-methyltransferase family protein [Naasia lichenicola]|uniref:Homocysteine S-methyltransferase family protein n=1 Tax=Naasia lichenicola TaxID=2565933 RepID=A0A4S4FK79_9MICO|nr:homocysteine S-methyltransferase family protein [Naasia lichenicola]THG29566.1 homocysteine S-methyltransferase family protein [Naasia lichenicola]
MARYRVDPPQLRPDALFLTDGGLETTLIFLDGIDLPEFAACELLRSADGRATLLGYYERFARLAAGYSAGFILDTATWRANPDWTDRLGYSDADFVEVNRAAIDLAVAIRDQWDGPSTPVVISGVVGPRGDGYRPDRRRTVDEARRYHSRQLEIFADSEVDVVGALTMNYVDEALGIALAARDAEVPVMISFTVETDGRLADGTELGEAITAVDRATDGYPLHYMVNCAHPDHLADDLDADLAADAPWLWRLRGYRANSSRQSHAELDESTELDDGDPVELGEQMRHLRHVLPALTVVGGCCGTDFRHIDQIARACA